MERNHPKLHELYQRLHEMDKQAYDRIKALYKENTIGYVMAIHKHHAMIQKGTGSMWVELRTQISNQITDELYRILEHYGPEYSKQVEEYFKRI